MNKLNFVPLKEVMNKMGIDESIKPNIEMLEKRKIIWRKISDFSGLDVDIKQNDLLKVTRRADGAIYMFKASKPLAYSIIKHKEIVLTEVSENEVDYEA